MSGIWSSNPIGEIVPFPTWMVASPVKKEIQPISPKVNGKDVKQFSLYSSNESDDVNRPVVKDNRTPHEKNSDTKLVLKKVKI